MTARNHAATKLYLDEDMADVAAHRIAGGLVAVYSARCPGKTSPNEDAAALIPVGASSAVFVVADGVGGALAGEAAAETAVRGLIAAVECRAAEGQPMRAAILDGIEQANRDLQMRGVGSATTLAVAEIDGCTVRPYHVGDSMILVTGQRGKTKLETVAHSPVGFGVEAGFLDHEEAMHHEDRHLVSNVVGSPDMRVEVGSPLRLASRDTLLLASDGLLDNLTVPDIVERIRSGPLARSAARLAADARQRMLQPAPGLPSKPDDLTFVAFRLAPVGNAERDHGISD